MFDLKLDLQSFKTLLRDFLIQLKEFSLEDNTGLYNEEKELELRQKEERERAQRSAVPGILKPSEIIDDDL